MNDGIQLYLIFAGSGALLGALITPLVYLFKRRIPANGFFVGLIIGGIGNLILLIPLWLLLLPLATSKADVFDIAVAYNMGVGAALGERREEARYYFSQVTQADPVNVSAWLYLANLSTTPMEAWSYIQQARAIDPGNPGVIQAVNLVYPQIEALNRG